MSVVLYNMSVAGVRVVEFGTKFNDPLCLSRRFNRKGEKRALESMLVVVGAHELDTDEPSEQRHYIERAVLHGNYSKDTKKYDIVLFQLNASIEFNEKVQPICVDASVFLPKTRCAVTGWGSTAPDGQKLQLLIMRRATVKTRKLCYRKQNRAMPQSV